MFFRSWPCNIKVSGKKMRHIQKLTINRKSTFFVQSSWNLMKINNSWVNLFCILEFLLMATFCTCLVFSSDFGTYIKRQVCHFELTYLYLPTTVKVDPAAMRVTSLSAIVLTSWGQDLHNIVIWQHFPLFWQ